MSTDPDAEAGLERLRAVARANPRSTAFVALAHALCESGRDEEAEEVCRQGLLQHPRLVTGQVALGRALINRGRFPEAKEVLVNAAKSNPEHGDVFRWLGDLVLRDGDADRARIILEYAEELMPSDARVADLLREAGGKPAPRAPRPRTDFENTRIGNTRALADRMHEDPTVVRASSADASTDEQRTPVVEALPPPPAAMRTTVDRIEPAPSSRWPGFLRQRPLQRLLALLMTALVGSLLVLAIMRQRATKPQTEAVLPPPAAPAPPKPLPDTGPLQQAILAGDLEGLQKVRGLTHDAGSGSPAQAELAALVALADALLAADWGLPVAAEARAAAEIAGRAQPAPGNRTAAIEAARAIAAAAEGRLTEGRAAAARALVADSSRPEARFGAGRIKLLAGELGGARVDLERALSAAPAFWPAALDHAALLIDAGEAAASVTALERRSPLHAEDLRAQLLILHASRSAARPADGAKVREACRASEADSAPLRAMCSLAAAADARLRGDRSGAVRSARAAAAAGGLQPRTTADAALLLASLGEIDAAAEALAKIKDHVGQSFVPRVWAEAAVALGRGEKVTSAALSTPPGPEARLVSARMAYAQGGAGALAAALARFGTAAVEYDPDLKLYAALAPDTKDGKLSSRVRRDLDRLARRGSGLAAYIVGRSALSAGDRRTAARRLYRALRGHGDACEAARLLGTIERRHRPAAVATDARIGAFLKGRNAGCLFLRPPAP